MKEAPIENIPASLVAELKTALAAAHDALLMSGVPRLENGRGCMLARKALDHYAEWERTPETN